MHTEVSIDVAAPAERVWQVLVDVEKWPEWTRSISNLERLDDADLGVGSRVQIKQPLVPPAIWRVTEFEPGRSFSWEAKGGAMKTVAGHRVVPVDLARSRVTLTVNQSGPLTLLLRPWISKVTRRYMDMEARGIKRRCERSNN